MFLPKASDQRYCRSIGTLATSVLFAACSSGSPGAGPGSGNTGVGGVDSGGSTQTIGSSAMGGILSGGRSTATGGTPSFGGTRAGESTATGGISSAGDGTGGGQTTGGRNASGGTHTTVTTKAQTSTGGASTGGGTSATGGRAATGGTSAGETRGSGGLAATGGTRVAVGGATATGGSVSGGNSSTGAWPPSTTFSNPVIWQDIPDPEVIRVDDAYYYTGSNMHYVPGAPILRSWDLVNWEFIGHAVPVYDYSAKYDLNGGQAYVKGTWASSLHYRTSNKTWYWIGCIEFGKTYVYTASSPDGTWSKHPAINNCYYDCGMMVNYDNDTDDTMYVAYGGSGNISVAQLSSDYLSEVKTQQVYTTGGSMTLEGSHFFKYKNYYYITPTRPANGEFVLRASNVWGPYTIKTLIDGQSGPIAGAGTPHQGSFIQTQKGDWYYMAFQDAYPGGRVPVLAPVTWSTDGWPSVTLSGNTWGKTYPYPDVPRPPRETKPATGTDTFTGSALSPEWEWNHNPDNTKWSLSSGLKLETATVTTDLYKARNTLTRRMLGPQSTATIEVDLSGMKDGDWTGLALFKSSSAWIGIKKSGSTMKVAMVNGLTQDLSSFNTTSTGTEAASTTFSGTTIYLRASADGRPPSGSGTKQGKFSYSTDGVTFTSLGSALTLSTDWQYFPGYRFAIFNFATTAVGGFVTVKSFTLTTP